MGRAWRLLIMLLALVAAIWLIPPFLPIESGLKFGWPYRAFFTLIVLFGAFWFYLLRMPSLSPPKSIWKALGSVALVYFISIGMVVFLANLAPQFAFEGGGPSGETAEARGKALFNDPNVGCFLCHTVAGSGGTRGPDLSHIATVAGNRRPAMSAEDYIRESLVDPSAYVVPPYDNIMPPIAQRLSPEVLADLISYLKGLR